MFADRYTGPTSTATKGTPPEQLPPEYTDPASRFYVPEELRPFYVLHAYGAKITGADMRQLAVEKVRAHVAEHPEHAANRVPSEAAGGAAAYRPSEGEIANALRGISDEDKRYLHHRLQLAQAEEDRQHAETNTTRTAARVAAWTCDLCSQQDPRTTGFVVTDGRAVKVTQAGARHDVKVCPACARVLDHELLERERTEPLPDHGRRATRGSVVRDWLATR